MNGFIDDPRRGIRKEDCPLAALSTRLHGGKKKNLPQKLWATLAFIIRVLTGGELSHGFWIIWDDEKGEAVAASQDETFKVRPLDDYLRDGCYLEVWRIKSLSRQRRYSLLTAIQTDLDKPPQKTRYDWPALFGQLLAAITGIEKFKKIQTPWIHFCTEIMETHLRAADIIVTKLTEKGYIILRQPSPDDMHEFFMREKNDFERLFKWISN